MLLYDAAKKRYGEKRFTKRELAKAVYDDALIDMNADKELDVLSSQLKKALTSGKYPEGSVEYEMLHYLDMIDAKMYDMQEVLEKTEPGAFSERVWTLDNRTLYRIGENDQ